MPNTMELEQIEAPLLTKEQRPAVPEGRQMLFCVGAQKAGTTWLAKNLAKNPACHFYPFEKELHYFDVAYGARGGMRSWKGRMIRRLLEDIEKLDDAAYARRVRKIQGELNLMKIYRDGPLGARAWMFQLTRDAKNERYLCDFTPDYAYSPPGAYQEMAEYISPEGRRPKFIFIMRDPVDRYWSFLRMMVRHRDIPEDEAENRLRQWMTYDMSAKELARRNHCDYRYTIEQLDAFVPPEDVLLLFYENMFEQPVFERICSFLDIEPHVAEPDKRIHEGLSLPFPEDRWDELRASLDDIYNFAFERFGDAVPQHWRRQSYR